MRARLRGLRGTDERDLAAAPALITLAGERAAAVLALDRGTPFVQPLEAGPALFLNDHRLAAAQWLRDGDRMRIGADALTVHVDATGIVLESTADVGFAASPPAVPLTPPPPAPVPRRRRVGATYVLVSLAVLAVALWFVFSARMLYVDIQPAPDQVHLEGTIPALRLSEGYLALPGPYRLQATREGYRPLVRDIEITRADNQRLALALEKLPGYLSVETPGVTGATVSAGAVVKGKTPLAEIELPPGEHEIAVRAEGYADFSTTVRIEGLGRRQALAVALVRASAAVTFQSNTAGATLEVDGKQIGTLPVTAELAAGTRAIEIHAPGHKPWKQSLSVVAGEAQSIGPITLAPADGELRVESEPPGASIALDGRYAGVTPATLALEPGQDHRVTVSKRGYGTASRSVRLRPAEKRELRVALNAEVGEVTLKVEPADATLSIEGRTIGPANGRHQLPAAPALLEITREGFEPARLWVTPRPGFAQTLSVKLRAAGAPAAAALPENITAPDGTVMILVRPGRFTMGASRRDPGQRANEALREVDLARPYYLGATEVTNAQFQKYRANHRSGRYGSLSLETPSHPVVNVRWGDAAGYCNWLNEAAQLPAAYTGMAGAMGPVLPMQHGFRLPTEAEWEWAARHAGVVRPSRFPWGDAMPPAAKSGNFADRSIAGELADALKDYSDGFVATAPVASFRPGPGGFFDLAGNAAEWVHDYYAIQAAPSQPDPLGPATGKLHVIRGSSWMQASISALRWTYRDYGIEPRPDVGFRCARYATGTP
ncbi:MAG TPA: PEGA domain-containing protein [Burkholderiales bacterium]|nr:PEGA domain-containing protein [Burkholderiales bacterium]